MTAAAGGITDFRIQNLGAAQSKTPFTFGQVFAAGALAPADGLTGQLPDGGALPLQVDVKATHADGSVRHAIVSGVLPSIAAGETKLIALMKAARAGGQISTPLPDARVALTIAGDVYTAVLAGALTTWLAGPIVCEGFVDVPLTNAAGTAHPALQVRFGVRSYAGNTRVEVGVENCKTWAPGQKFAYDVEVTVGGKVVYSAKGLTHYHHARWHRYAWTSGEPQVDVKLNTAYLIASQAVPNYDQSVLPAENVLAGMAQALTADNSGPMKIGTVTPDMGNTGGRGDIGLLPDWCVNYLLTMDKRAKDVMLANADGSGTWSIHYRDEKTGYPLRTDSDATSRVSIHPNMASDGPLPVPRFVSDSDGGTPYNPDMAHEPSLGYLPYLVTGDYYYLEELQFWASVNPLATAPGYNGYGQGLLRWHQLRGQAWTMRTLGETVYITPDASPMKGYFTQQLDNNLNFYTQTYVVGNPNGMGMYDGSGDGAFTITGAAPWQDDFFTSAFGHLAELGFGKAKPIAQWKAKFPVGRMVGDGFCHVLAAHYAFPTIRGANGAIFNSFGDLYNGNFGAAIIPNDNWELRPERVPAGMKWNELQCDSQAQADYLGAINGFGWPIGRMVGYADSTLGYVANMQPALAMAADLGASGADKAWALFQARLLKPDYSQNPQWNIIPRSIPQAVTAPVTAPAPANPVLTLGQKPKDETAGTWTKIGNEGDKVQVAAGTFLRYGAVGRGYAYAQALAASFGANNAAFGGDPAQNVVKEIDAFKVNPPKAPGKITTPSSTKAAGLKGLTVDVFDPAKLAFVKSFPGVSASTKGVISLADPALEKGVVYAATVKNAKGEMLLIFFPLTAVN